MQGEGASASVVGILAGGGSLPREIADAAAAAGRRVVIVGLEGEASAADLAPHDVTIVNWGCIGELVRTFRDRGVRDLVIVGRVSRPDLGAVRTDLGFWRNLPRILKIIAAGGDDNVLRRVVRFFEAQGFRVLGPAEVAPSLVIAEGPLGRHGMPEEAARDAEAGSHVIARLAPFDIGQAVVVARGRIVAIEGVEGTDAMLARVAAAGAEASGGVLVKRPKPGQELRVDMPAIGPHTIAGARRAGLAGIAVEAGATLSAERAALIREADAGGLFVAGIVPRPAARRSRTALEDDGAIGLDVLAALQPYVPSRGAIVVRRHVLAVESGEGLRALIARAAGLRQWGRARRGRRRGALAVSSAADLDPSLLAAAAEAGYRSIAVADACDGDVEALHRTARAAGLRLDGPAGGAS